MNSQSNLNDKAGKVLLILSCFFVANALIAECIGVKLFSLEKVLGFSPKPFSFFGQDGLTFTLTAGVLLWPLEFVMTDIVNEYYGQKVVKRISKIAVALILYAFAMFYLAIQLPEDMNFWVNSKTQDGVPNMQQAFSVIFGQGMWIIIGSVAAFFMGQIIDVWIFHKIKQKTGDSKVWLRSTGSTIVSQFFDSFIVLFIAFYIGQGWSIQRVFAICLVSYIYKASVALLLTPLIYIVQNRIDKYLGAEKAEEMKRNAMLVK